MFYRYEIKNNGKEEILYLYLTMTYEFSKELGLKSNNNEISRRTKNFIKNNSIDFKGNKIYLVIDDIIVKTLEIKKDEEIEILKMSNEIYNNNSLITLKNENNTTIEISLKDYLLGVLATNTINNLELTTLKSLCILYRTYAYKQMKENKYILSTNLYQLYKPITYYKLIWLDNYQTIYNKFIKAINDTECEFITYNNYYILPFTHITNNGKTEKKFEIPYLESRISLWDYTSPYYLEINDFDYPSINKILKLEKNSIKDITILELNESNHIKKIKIGKKIFSGDELKFFLNLKSTDINIIINPTFIRFITKGWGNNLGLSQYGANEMAKVGCSYLNIIKYYFPQTTIKKYI